MALFFFTFTLAETSPMTCFYLLLLPALPARRISPPAKYETTCTTSLPFCQHKERGRGGRSRKFLEANESLISLF